MAYFGRQDFHSRSTCERGAFSEKKEAGLGNGGDSSSIFLRHSHSEVALKALAGVASLCFLTVSVSYLAASHFHRKSSSTERVVDILWTIRLALPLISNDSLANHLKEITVHPHLAGSAANFKAAAYVEAKLEEYGLTVHTADFPVLLSYPLRQHVTVIRGSHPANLSLHEGTFPEDPYSADPAVTEPFLAYSAAGDVTARVVYANYGSVKDFARLRALGVDCSGVVVLMRYGRIFRGDKVSNAADNGAAAAILYSDPADYAPGGVRPNETYPSTPFLPESGAQRGSIITSAPGDPQTPGWPSCDGCERFPIVELQASGALPSIPALPIGYGNARIILDGLGGPDAPASWRGALPGTAYRLGPGPVEVRIVVERNLTVAPVRNVIGVLRGVEEPDRYVVVGSHADAWVFGAVDPNSGTSCLLELARVLAALRHFRGWQPRRSIVLASWDAEEYNLIGSTEWVERNLGLLSHGAIAYLNADPAVAGGGFSASATPQLDDAMRQAAGMVQDPDGVPGRTVLDSWAARSNRSTPALGRLGGGGSDFAAFLQHAGIASADFGFGGEYPVYHSAYDNFHWMSHFGDPLFRRHVAATAIWLVLAVRLSSEAVLPFNYSAYASALKGYVADVAAALSAAECPSGRVSLQPLEAAVVELAAAAASVQEEAEKLLLWHPEAGNLQTGASWRTGEWAAACSSLNNRLMLAERGLLDPAGVAPSLAWYRHAVYGPSPGDDYGTAVFPAIHNALKAASAAGQGVVTPRGEGPGEGTSHPGTGGRQGGAWETVQHDVFRAARAVSRASSILRGGMAGHSVPLDLLPLTDAHPLST